MKQEACAPYSDPALLELGLEFYDEVQPANFPEKILRYENKSASHKLGVEIDALHFAEFKSLAGNLPQALALRYHGHQFQHYNPDLGDGRGFVYAQIRADGKLFDLGTKGSGTTPWSRSGDGRLTLKGAVREALATELLLKLGVNTSQTFCFFETGEKLQRNDEPSPTRSAVLTRMSHSHIRFGTFQRLAYFNQRENLAKLVDYCVRHYDAEIQNPDSSQMCLQFFQRICRSAASTLAEWMMAGFVHGVLNTDNMNMTGESFDYGPYRFLPTYDPLFTAAYFDHQGLYAYGRQPSAVMWNLQALAASFKVLHPELDLSSEIEKFPEIFSELVMEKFLSRLNLEPRTPQENENLFSQFFAAMAKTQSPFEQSFYDHHSGFALKKWTDSPSSQIFGSDEFKDFHTSLKSYVPQSEEKLKKREAQDGRACTLLIDEIEMIWDKIARLDDWSTFHQKIDQIRNS